MVEKKAPEIRFKGFTDDWEQRKFSELYEKVTEKNDLTYGVKDIISVANMYYKPDANITDEEYLKTYNIMRIGDIAFEGNKSKNFAHGRFVENTIGNGIVSHVFDVFRPVMEYDLLFWKYLINNEGIMRSILVRCTKASTMMTNLVANDFLNEIIFVPSIDEQRKIGTFLCGIDNLITLHQRKHKKLLAVKKSMLEKMFPQNGAKVPEIRFDGFTDDWEQRKFDELADYKKGPFGSVLKKEIFVPDGTDSVKVYEQQNAINKDWHLERYFITKSYANQLKDFETHGGDIIVSCAGTIGEIYELPLNARPGVINQALMRVRVNERIVRKDIFKLLFSNMIDSFSKEFSNGSAMKNIPPFADLKPMETLVPNLTEQQAIGEFFTEFDNLITLHQRKLDKLLNIKKSLLEKMFP